MIGRYQYHGSVGDRKNDLFTIKRLRQKANDELAKLRDQRRAVDRAIKHELAWLKELRDRERVTRKLTADHPET